MCATFAYFSVTVSDEGVSTTVKAEAAEMPVITIATTGSSFGVSVTAEDMAKPESANKSMWGIVDHNSQDNKSSDNTVGWWADSAQNISIVKMTSSGSDKETYECPITITAALTGEMKDVLTAGDAKLHLYGPDASSVKITGDSGGALTTDGTTYDLNDWKDSGSGTINLTVQINGNDSIGKEISADLEFINKITPQNSLAGKDVTVTLTTTGGECKVIPTGD